jgi:hypothetical protein
MGDVMIYTRQVLPPGGVIYCIALYLLSNTFGVDDSY